MSDPTGSDRRALPNEVEVSISIGEYLDRLTILELKSERGGSWQARESALARLATWKRSFDRAALDRAAVTPLVGALRRVNCRLWECEDAIRRHMARSDAAGVAEVGADIVRLNDERASIKAELDRCTGAAWSDSKHYIIESVEPSAGAE